MVIIIFNNKFKNEIKNKYMKIELKINKICFNYQK